jgi:putative FmdB family regulatory protein
MPTYEYVCEKCEHEFETFRSISAPPLKTCPKDQCAQKKWGRGRLKKKISTGGGLIFKGSGFYGTDYRSESYKQGAEKAVSDSRPPAASDAKPAAKTESKPASKPASKATKK